MSATAKNKAVMQRALLTRQEAAERLRVHIATLDRHVKDGSIPSIKLDKTVRIPADFIESLLAEGRR